jgi:hypothetical protein
MLRLERDLPFDEQALPLLFRQPGAHPSCEKFSLIPQHLDAAMYT